jgi:hypothetical protein
VQRRGIEGDQQPGRHRGCRRRAMLGRQSIRKK